VGVLTKDERLNGLTASIIGAAIEVHRVLGPGLLESIYLACLQFELSERGLRFEAQKPVPVFYKSIRLSTVHRIDLLVEDT
jgi:GxxExxY protein